MILIEKDAQKTQDQSMSPNSEKDFKELIDEIDKVRNQNSSNSETDGGSKENNSNSPKSQNEEGKSSTKNIEIIPNKMKDEKQNIKELNQEKEDDLNYSDKNQKKSSLLMNLNINNKINNYYNNNIQLNNFELSQNGINSKNVNSINNQNNFRTNVYNNSYCYQNDNNMNIFGTNKSTLNNYYSNNTQINSDLSNNDSLSYNNNCFNNDVNNNLLISVLKNQILNDLKKQQIQENTYRNINIICNYVNNFNNNNFNVLLQNEIQKQLINLEKNYNNDIYQKLLLLNSIENNINSINNNPNQNEINCFNINNNINNLINLNLSNNNSNINQNYPNEDLFNCNSNNINNNNQFQSTYSNKKKSTAQTRKKFKNKSPIDISKNQINLMNIFLCEDNRTTLMIKNIPNKYTISSFLEEINIYFKHTYDVFYLPIDYVNKCNLGFAFINFVEPLHIILFYELYRGKKWKKFKSDKICELLYAKFQNKKELISHFEKGKVLFYDSAEKRPLILPTPKILPKINIPYYYLNLFTKLYPKVSYEIKEFKYYKDKKNNNEICNDISQINNNQIFLVFSINGNFNMHKNK